MGGKKKKKKSPKKKRGIRGLSAVVSLKGRAQNDWQKLKSVANVIGALAVARAWRASMRGRVGATPT